jgi:hypothetical protein
VEHDAAGTKGERFDDAIGQAASGERLPESGDEGEKSNMDNGFTSGLRTS